MHFSALTKEHHLAFLGSIVRRRFIELPWWYHGQKSTCQAGKMVLISGLGRFHKPQRNQACMPQLLSLCSRAHELQLLKLAHPESRFLNKGSHHNEKPLHHNEEQPLLTTTRESLWTATKTQCNQKLNNFLEKKLADLFQGFHFPKPLNSFFYSMSSNCKYFYLISYRSSLSSGFN